MAMSVQESLAEVWVGRGLLQSQRHSAAVLAWDLLKEVTVIFITSSIVWPQVKQQGGNTACQSTENWIKDLLNMAPPFRTRSSSFPVSLSHHEAP